MERKWTYYELMLIIEVLELRKQELELNIKQLVKEREEVLQND
jgi:hypothetical protein